MVSQGLFLKNSGRIFCYLDFHATQCHTILLISNFFVQDRVEVSLKLSLNVKFKRHKSIDWSGRLLKVNKCSDLKSFFRFEINDWINSIYELYINLSLIIASGSFDKIWDNFKVNERFVLKIIFKFEIYD